MDKEKEVLKDLVKNLDGRLVNVRRMLEILEKRMDSLEMVPPEPRTATEGE